jgi:hypothetical protein
MGVLFFKEGAPLVVEANGVNQNIGIDRRKRNKRVRVGLVFERNIFLFMMSFGFPQIFIKYKFYHLWGYFPRLKPSTLSIFLTRSIGKGLG